MSDPKQAANLAKTFEPILLFHEDEQFFPIDPKWYLERCALWRAVPDSAGRFDDKANWGEPPRTVFPRQPQIAKNKIAALASETAGGQTWIGTTGADFGVTTAPDSQHRTSALDERFLEFVGWEAPPGTGIEEVTSSSVNRHAAFTPSNYTTPLSGSRPWYYVEYMDHQDLLQYVGNPNLSTNGLKLFQAIVNNPDLSSPQALIYHLFYPVHQEALEHCEGAGEGDLFGTYAGEWACIAILLDSANNPLYVGLTSRNVGKPAIVGIEDQRVGMTVSEWSKVQGVGTHPKIFVSLETHGNYLGPEPGAADPHLHPVTSFSPPAVDPSRNSCGQVETLDDVISGETTLKPGMPGSDDSPSTTITLVKIFLIPWGYIWAAAEGIDASKTDPTDPVLASPTPPVDRTGGPTFKIIRPQGLSFAETAGAPMLTDWNVDPYTTPAPDGRAYGFVVDRIQQVWWAPRPAPRPASPDLPGAEGFSGRWGPRVMHDPNSRRAGMKCPDFLLLFLEAVAIKRSPS